MSIFLYRLSGRLAAVVLVAACCVSAEADTLIDHFGSAIPGYTGVAPYSGTTLDGSVAYAVFTESGYETTFPGGYDVPSGSWAYVYQILNGDGDPVSQNAILGVNDSVTGIGDATIDGGASEVAPQSSTLVPVNPTTYTAVWDFSGQGNNIPSLGNSNGLILTSTHKPSLLTSLDVLKDGGGSATADVIAPGDIEIPEPASLLLLGLGSTLLLAGRRRR